MTKEQLLRGGARITNNGAGTLITENKIQNEGAIAFGEMLKTNTALVSLYLTCEKMIIVYIIHRNIQPLTKCFCFIFQTMALELKELPR